MENQRSFYLDNIKIFLTIIVIIHHTGQAYGPTGGFWEFQNSLGEFIPWLGRFFGMNAAYFMGFFFLISGYFIPMSYDRNDGKHFSRKRLLRYGVPLLFVFLIMKPLQMYFHYSFYTGNIPLSFFQYYTNVWLGLYGMPERFIVTDVFPEMNFGHAWFLEHLLVYSIFYWFLRKIFKRPFLSQESKSFSIIHILAISLIIAIISFIVRVWYPIDDWKGIFGFFQVEVAHWPQYIILFVAGIIAYRKNWLSTLKTRTGYASLLIGILMAAGIYIFNKIWDIWAVYESFFAVFLIFGLLTLFREKVNRTTPFLKTLSRCSYGAYIFHFPVVLTVQFALDRVVIGGAFGKFITVSFISIALTYTLSFLLLKIKALNKIL